MFHRQRLLGEKICNIRQRGTLSVDDVGEHWCRSLDGWLPKRVASNAAAPEQHSQRDSAAQLELGQILQGIIRCAGTGAGCRVRAGAGGCCRVRGRIMEELEEQRGAIAQ